ncbi:MAG TPA: FlgD immunoglobulin-like domain containing protein [Thermoanaerobaculia bacterium]
MKRLLALLLTLAALPLAAQTNVSGTISTNTTWTVAGSPYILTGNVFVEGSGSPVLTIDPGVVVKGNANTQLLANFNNKGAIVAVGTAGSPILFTANNSTTAGFWYGVRIGSTANGPASSIEHATVEYAGSNQHLLGGITVHGQTSTVLGHVVAKNNLYAGIKIENAGATISDSEVKDNSGYGLYLRDYNAPATTLTNVAATGNSGIAFSAPSSVQLSGMSGLSASSNTGGDVIELRAETIRANRTWHTSAVPYLVVGSVMVEHSSAPVLTIEAGNTIRFAASSQIAVNHDGAGSLVVNGTSSAPVLFTSKTAQTAGSWWGLHFGYSSQSAISSMSYATVEYGGAANLNRGGLTLYATNTPPVFDHVTLRNNAFGGIAMHRGNATLTNATVTGNSGPGIHAFGGDGMTLTDVAFTNNAGYAASVPASFSIGGATGLSASGNGTGKDGIEFRAGTIGANRTWKTSAIPYIVTGGIGVEGNSSPVLTIEPGNTIRFNANSQIAVNHANKGALAANGTALAPILFTSNTTQTAGAWWGLHIGRNSTTLASSIAHATIEYGGATGLNRGGLTLYTSDTTPSTFDHVTIRNNQYAGIAVHQGRATVTNATITANGGPGIRVVGGVGMQLSDTALTNNSGYAMTAPCNFLLTGLSGNTASGNVAQGDGIELREATIRDDVTWGLSSLPRIITGGVFVDGTAAPVLTIAPGNVLRFNGSSQIAVNFQDRGGLQANGTAAAPILFTSNAATPTAGSWWGLYFGNTASAPQSKVSYATIEYGGLSSANRGGVTVMAHAPQFDHLIVRNSVVAGLATHTTNANPLITNSHFTANPGGIVSINSGKATAALNYWSDAAGPCAPGSCGGGRQSVPAANVTYEPWLTSAPTDPQFLTVATQKNRSFNPAIQAATTLDYTPALSGDVTVTIRDASNNVVRSYTTSGTSGSTAWDGKNGSGVIQPDGTYSYELAAVATSQPPAAIARGVAVIDSNKTLTLANASISQLFFSPNADAVQDTTVVASTSNYDDPAWTVSVLDASSNVVRTANGTGGVISFTWDGRNGSNVVQPDGVYTLRIDATVGTATVQKTATSTLDITPPSLTIATPAAHDVLSNVYSNGPTLVTPTGSVLDTNLKDWMLRAGFGTTPTSWSFLGGGTTGQVNNGNLGQWETANTANGDWTLRLSATDKAGNAAQVNTFPVKQGNFLVAVSAHQFNVNNQTLTYTSTVPFPLTETLVVKNEAGSVVRTLVNGVARAPGSYPDVFNGRNDSNVVLPDGPYFYVATVTDGTHTFTWDLTNVFLNNYGSFNDGLNIQDYDPFNNKPMKFNYNFSQPGRVTIATSTNPGSVVGTCGSPNATFFCPVIDRWEESGPKSYAWSGIDHNGNYRGVRSVAIVTATSKFSKNAAVMFGGKPKVENVKVTPPVYGPEVGTQTIEFDLTTYQAQPANISLAFVNLASHSTLRTIALSNIGVGHVSTSWDGLADNGMRVAPGFYHVIVTAVDAQGNTVSSDILTTIKY